MEKDLTLFQYFSTCDANFQHAGTFIKCKIG